MSGPVYLYTNSDWDFSVVWLDRDENPVEINPAGDYRASIRPEAGGDIVFTWATLGELGVITVTTIEDYELPNGETADVKAMVFHAEQADIENIAAGIYAGDVLQIDAGTQNLLELIVPVNAGYTVAP